MAARRLVERLEQLGLVVSTAGPTHRQRRGLRPTSRGVVAADELAARSGAWNGHIVRLLGAAEYTHLQHVLAHLETLLAAEAPELGPRPTDDNRPPIGPQESSQTPHEEHQ